MLLQHEGPQLASRIASIDQLAILLALSMTGDADSIEWHLETDAGEKRIMPTAPRFDCADMAAVRTAAIAGLLVTILPDHICREALSQGPLMRVLAAWRWLQGIVYLVFTTRPGLPPAVRALIDHLAAGFLKEVAGG